MLYHDIRVIVILRNIGIYRIVDHHPLVCAIAHGLLNLLHSLSGKVTSEDRLDFDDDSELFSLRELEEFGANAVILVEVVGPDLSNLSFIFTATG